MKTRKFYYLLAVCALLTLPFTSCKDDDDDGLLTPANAVSNLSFVDQDIEEGKIEGTLKWTLPEKEDFIDTYVIYLGETVTDKATKLGEVNKGVTSFEIPKGTEAKPYFLVVAKNATGESSNVASLAVNDNSGNNVVSPKFTDTDNTMGKIGGTLSWELPASEVGLTGYVIYASNESGKKDTKLGEVAAGVTSFEIPQGTDYVKYLVIVTKTEAGEIDKMNHATVEDVYTRGFYILNCGNDGANNASLSYYDYEKGELTTEVYKKANGKGLGDSAEQLLIYGSKMYVTVTASNRIAVLDKDAKEVKSITPEGSEPMNPRCMVADNGKVYISYYYGHSVAVLDTTSLEIENVIPVGRYPEQLALSEGKIYVANSGGLDYNTELGRGKTVSVIDQESQTVTKDIEVVINPTKLATDSQGDIYVISMGDYGDVKNTLQRIDVLTNEVTEMGNASDMTLVNDKLYTIYAQWGDAAVTYKKYDTQTEKVISDNFVSDEGKVSPNNSPIIAVNPVTEGILMVEAPYGATSSIFMFTPEGKLTGDAIDTGGYYAKCIVFN